MQEIANQIRSGQLQTAEKQARLALSSSPDDGRVRELLGQILSRTKRPIEAREQLEIASCLVPLSPNGQLLLAECYLGEGHLQLALDMLSHLSRRDDADVLVLRSAAEAADSCDHPWIAREIAIRAARRFSDAQLWYELGYYCVRMGCPVRHAEGHARKAIELDPENVEYRIGLCSLLAKNDRLSDAFELVRRFGKNEVDRVCCESCLRTLLTVYELSNDSLRASLCQTRLDEGFVPPCCG
jgi:Flp pilus assembly protein TadD